MTFEVRAFDIAQQIKHFMDLLSPLIIRTSPTYNYRSCGRITHCRESGSEFQLLQHAAVYETWHCIDLSVATTWQMRVNGDSSDVSEGMQMMGSFPTPSLAPILTTILRLEWSPVYRNRNTIETGTAKSYPPYVLEIFL